MKTHHYVYIGSRPARRLAEAGFSVQLRKGEQCDPVRLPDGHVVRSTKAGVANALVEFEDGTRTTVSPRRLRLVSKLRRCYLVGCSKSKREGVHQAQHLYTGDLFQKCRRYVKSQLVLDGWWRILSAQYFALHPYSATPSYDNALSAASAESRRTWARMTALSLCAEAEERTHFIVLAGRAYREHFVPLLRAQGHPVSVPMEGLGIGEQKRWLLDRTPDAQ